MFSQLGLYLKYLELVVVDLVHLADQFFMFFDELKVVLLDRYAVIGVLHYLNGGL